MDQVFIHIYIYMYKYTERGREIHTHMCRHVSALSGSMLPNKQVLSCTLVPNITGFSPGAHPWKLIYTYIYICIFMY